MLIAHTPVRLSFFGGGTDLPSYYTAHGGAVLSTTIDKYIYVVLRVHEQSVLQITSSDYRTFYRHEPGTPLLWEGDLLLPRAVLRHFGVTNGVSLFLASEVPPGTGLGSSSSVTVGLVKAISTACGQRLSPAQVAQLACHIEIEVLGRPIGVQDQYAAAFGGFNWMTFDADGVRVEPLALPQATLARLERNTLLMFTGAARDSSEILARQNRASAAREPAVIEALQVTHALALEARRHLLNGALEQFGALLDQAWQHKQRFAAGISNDQINHWYRLACQNGALGGKIAGAGGGGFMLLYCDDEAVERVASVLSEAGLRRMAYRFATDGARVLFNAGLRLRQTGPLPAGPEGNSLPAAQDVR